MIPVVKGWGCAGRYGEVLFGGEMTGRKGVIQVGRELQVGRERYRSGGRGKCRRGAVQFRREGYM